MSYSFFHWVHKKAFSPAQVSQGEQLLNEQFKCCHISLEIQFRVISAARVIFEHSPQSSGNLERNLMSWSTSSARNAQLILKDCIWIRMNLSSLYNLKAMCPGQTTLSRDPACKMVTKISLFSGASRYILGQSFHLDCTLHLFKMGLVNFLALVNNAPVHHNGLLSSIGGACSLLHI